MSEDSIDSQISSYEDRISAAGYDPDNPPAIEKAVEDKPSIFDESREFELRSSLGKIYDRNQAASEKAEERQIVPSITADDTTQSAMGKTWEYLHASPKERATQRDASQLVETVRTNAAKFGVELSDTEAMKAAMELERDQARAAPSEFAPALETIRRNYPDQAPHEVVGRYSEIDSYFKRAPAEAAGWIYQQQTGQHPLELARQIASQHSPQQHQEFYATRDVNTFFDLVPDAAKLQPQMVAALERGEIQRTGNIIKDMQSVYQHVRGSKPQGSRKGARRSMESEMEETYRRIYSR